ncbi:MAG TPA: prepilin-type N-terminal cleavage/methylation domain-containing protein [Vicinamibacterales bacterium]|nr:prepilin-type N-terminal cleavage/methylation domain-containing protein [Vicinamibacterales bacterium]
MQGSSVSNERGFSLIELIMVMAAMVTLAAVLVPSFKTLTLSMKARDAARKVERELQTARLKAVTVSRTLRVRFNCPSAGQFRIIELTGIAATDGSANRCSQTAFPFPAPIDTLKATPQFDSPVFSLPTGTTIAGTTLAFEFDPRGNVYAVNTGTGTVTKLTADASIAVARYGWTNTVTINALGKIKLN